MTGGAAAGVAGLGLAGAAVVASPTAEAATGQCGFTGGNLSAYSASYGWGEASVSAGSAGCDLTAGEGFEFAMPSGITPFSGSFNDGDFTCTTSGQPASNVHCTANSALDIPAGSSVGIEWPVNVSGSASGTETFSGSTDWGASTTGTIKINTCSVSTPLLDPTVAGEALGGAGVAAGIVALLRRRRQASARVAG